MNNRFYLGTIAALVIIILSLWTCNGCLKGKLADCEEKKDPGEVVKVVTKIDTVYVLDSFVKTAYVPKPYAVIKSRVDSFIQFEGADTMAILERYTETLQDYFSRVYYLDSQATQYGKIYIHDTLSKNRIAGRSVRTAFTIPVVTKETVIEREQRRNQVYIGINAQGSQADYLNAFGPSLMLKTKGDKVFELGALYNKQNDILFQAGIKFKLSFK